MLLRECTEAGLWKISDVQGMLLEAEKTVCEQVVVRMYRSASPSEVEYSDEKQEETL